MATRVTKNTAVSVHDISPADTVRVTKASAYAVSGVEDATVRVSKAAAYVVVGPIIRTVNTTNVIICT